MLRFPKLYERINEVVSTTLGSRLSPTKEFVSHLVEIELAYINTRHPDFVEAGLANFLRESGLDDKKKRPLIQESPSDPIVSNGIPAIPKENGLAKKEQNLAQSRSSYAAWLFNRSTPDNNSMGSGDHGRNKL